RRLKAGAALQKTPSRRAMVVKAKESKDVVMAPVKEGKVRRTISKSQKRKAKKAGDAAKENRKESRKERRKRIGSSARGGEAAEQLQLRQAAEWKEMKAQVALLKKQRGKLPRRGSKDEKQEVAQKIRQMQEDMQVRHLAERKATGVEAPVGETDDMDL
ncbi:unnamed protein product, partial [Effrenium voratum]